MNDSSKALLMMHMKACFPEMGHYDFEQIKQAIQMAAQVNEAFYDFVQDDDKPEELAATMLECN